LLVGFQTFRFLGQVNEGPYPGADNTGRVDPDRMEIMDSADEQPVPLPITDVLDLHTFNPKDVKDLVPTYLEECRNRGILDVACCAPCQ